MRNRKLRAKALLEEQIDPVFSRVDEGVSRRASMRYPMRDILMAGLAMFTFKSPSLHRFERDTRDGGALRHNVRLLYGVREVPTDEAIRQRGGLASWIGISRRSRTTACSRSTAPACTRRPKAGANAAA